MKGALLNHTFLFFSFFLYSFYFLFLFLSVCYCSAYKQFLPFRFLISSYQPSKLPNRTESQWNRKLVLRVCTLNMYTECAILSVSVPCERVGNSVFFSFFLRRLWMSLNHAKWMSEGWKSTKYILNIEQTKKKKNMKEIIRRYIETNFMTNREWVTEYSQFSLTASIDYLFSITAKSKIINRNYFPVVWSLNLCIECHQCSGIR